MVNDGIPISKVSTPGSVVSGSEWYGAYKAFQFGDGQATARQIWRLRVTGVVFGVLIMLKQSSIFSVVCTRKQCQHQLIRGLVRLGQKFDRL